MSNVEILNSVIQEQRCGLNLVTVSWRGAGVMMFKGGLTEGGLELKGSFGSVKSWAGWPGSGSSTQTFSVAQRTQAGAPHSSGELRASLELISGGIFYFVNFWLTMKQKTIK